MDEMVSMQIAETLNILRIYWKQVFGCVGKRMCKQSAQIRFKLFCRVGAECFLELERMTFVVAENARKQYGLKDRWKL